MLSCLAVTALLLSIPIATATDEAAPTSQWLPALLISVGVIIMLVLWSISIRGRSARKSAEYVTPREQIERIKAGHRTRDIEGALTAEFVTSATELAARLENKAERLEQLIEQADARLTRLQRALGEVDAPSAQDVSDRPQPIADNRQPTASPALEPDDPLARAVIELAEAGRTPVEIAQHLEEQVGKVELILALRRQ